MQARSDDIAMIKSLYLTGATHDGLASHYVERTISTDLKDLSNYPTFLVLRDKNVIFGMVGVTKEGEICRLMVHPEYRGKGHGHTLLSKAIANGGTHLETLGSNGVAIHLYEKYFNRTSEKHLVSRTTGAPYTLITFSI